MTNKEAIMLLNPKTTVSALAEIEYYNGFSGKEACIEAIEEACRLAIEALEKQIPKKPISSKYEQISCPNCSVSLVYCLHSYKASYCEECGQRLDWEGIE